jgi:hypothetical protein
MGEFYAEGGYARPAARAARPCEQLLASPDRQLLLTMPLAAPVHEADGHG